MNQAAFFFVVEIATGHIVERRQFPVGGQLPNFGPNYRAIRVREEDFGSIMDQVHWDLLDESAIPPRQRQDPLHDFLIDPRRKFQKGEKRVRRP